MEYQKPKLIRVSRMKETEKLYSLEHKRDELIVKCCREWSELFEVPEKYFWQVALPQGLYDLLESFDSKASILACISYLELYGYEAKESVCGISCGGESNGESN